MIKLPNGEYWITNSDCGIESQKQYNDEHYAGHKYEDITRPKYIEEHKSYDTDYKKFVDTVYAHFYDSGYTIEGKYKHPYLLPRKLVNRPDLARSEKEVEWYGYWDCNFDALNELFVQIAVKIKYYCWGEVYESPWGEVYVKWIQADSSGYSQERGMKKFDNWNTWLRYLEEGESEKASRKRQRLEREHERARKQYRAEREK